MPTDAVTSRAFAVVAPGKAARLTVLALMLIPTAIVVGVVLLAFRQQGHDAWFGAALALPVLIGVAVLLLVSMRRRSVQLEGDRLVVRATLYTQRIPVSRLRLDQARVVDLREHRELRPSLKSNGFAVPGMYAGHFRAGLFGPGFRQRLFCLVTDSSRVLALPEDDGRVLLLSLERPQALLDALRAQAGGTSLR